MLSVKTFSKTGVIGYPVGHSKSPAIHNHWLAKYGLDGVYGAVPISPETLASGVQGLVSNGYAGFNVTVPHKQTIMELCDTLDDAAQAIGAVNTVMIEQGRLKGFNTDAYGFLQNLTPAFPDISKTGGRPVVILGSGGAARAVAYGLVNSGVQRIIVANRTDKNAASVEAMYPGTVQADSWANRDNILADAALLINTTSLGMTGMESLEISLDGLPPDAAVCDIVYAPLMTDLLKNAQSRGNTTVTGIGMLLHQAAAAFNLWHGIMPEVTRALEEKILS